MYDSLLTVKMVAPILMEILARIGGEIVNNFTFFRIRQKNIGKHLSQH